jgi:hypothetical protein
MAQWLNVDLWTRRSWFDSRSGHMTRLQAWSPVWGVQEVADQWFSLVIDVSLSLSLPLPFSLKSIKIYLNMYMVNQVGKKTYCKAIILSNKRVICKLTVPLLHPPAMSTSHAHQPTRASMQINPTKMATATESRREVWVSQATEKPSFPPALAGLSLHSRLQCFNYRR